MSEAYPWKIHVTNVPGELPKVIIQNMINNNFIRNEDVRRRIEYLVTKSGREYLNITFGILLTTPTNDYYLGIILNNPPITLPPTIPSIDSIPGNVANWTTANLHVVLVYISDELVCNITEVGNTPNIGGCLKNFAVQLIERFSLRIRVPPIVQSNSCNVTVNGKSMCDNT
jgi:hypothetical protein